METTKQIAKQKLQSYVQNLFKYLRLTKNCFVSGAFVIDDPTHTLKNLLRNSNDLTLNHLQSHNKFLPSKDTTKTRSHNACQEQRVCETHYDEGFNVTCNPARDEALAPRHNLKWYSFDSATGELDRLVYLKTEDYKTISAGHIMGGINRYVLGTKGAPVIDAGYVRREDCQNDKKGCVCTKSGCPMDPKFASEGVLRFNHTTNLYTRGGDEVFIPSDLNTALLSNASFLNTISEPAYDNDHYTKHPYVAVAKGAKEHNILPFEEQMEENWVEGIVGLGSQKYQGQRTTVRRRCTVRRRRGTARRYKKSCVCKKDKQKRKR